MRAIEEFQDLNYEDLDVMAPPSGPDFRKEREVAGLLDDYLGQMIENGVFDDCDLRGKYSPRFKIETSLQEQSATLACRCC